MNKIALYVSCYAIVVVAVPFIIVAQILDSFIRMALDVWMLHRYIQTKADKLA
jgi:uncharacterized membrane protein YraQ (UPF0718 family)